MLTLRGCWHFFSSGLYRLVFECASLAALRAKYADLFSATTMHPFFAQSYHLRVFHYVIHCLNMMNA